MSSVLRGIFCQSMLRNARKQKKEKADRNRTHECTCAHQMEYAGKAEQPEKAESSRTDQHEGQEKTIAG